MKRIRLSLSKLIIFGGILLWVFGISHTKLQLQRILAAADSTTTISVDEHSLRQDLRRLFEEHSTWERMFIIDTAANSTFADADTNRLLQNADDIGNFLKPYYGDAAASQLVTLLRSHVSGMSGVVTAARANDVALMDSVNLSWYDNANQIADFLAALNPKWTQTEMRALWKQQLDLAKRQAVDIFEKDAQGSVTDYDKIHESALQLSDALSSGLVKQFPNKF